MADPLIELAQIERENAGILIKNWDDSLGNVFRKQKLEKWIAQYDSADIHAIERDSVIKFVADYATYIAPAAKKYEEKANALAAEGVDMEPLKEVKSSKKIQTPPGLGVSNQELKIETKITDEQKQKLEKQFTELQELSEKIYAADIRLDEKQQKAMLNIQGVLYEKPMDSRKVAQALEEAKLVHNSVTRPNAKVIDLLQAEKRRIENDPKCHGSRGTARVQEIDAAIKKINTNRNMTDAEVKKCVTGLLKFDDKVKAKLGVTKKEEASPLMQAVEHVNVRKNSPR